MQDRQVSKENQVVAEFLKHFNYLNKNNKRAGFLLFGCSELTQRLEASAKVLRTELQALLTEPKSFEEKNLALVEKVKKTLDQVRKDRLATSTVKSDISPYFMTTMEGAYLMSTREACDYKIAHSDGKFEKNLVAGLEAARKCSDLDDVAFWRMSELLENIAEHEPEIEKIPENTFSSSL